MQIVRVWYPILGAILHEFSFLWDLFDSILNYESIGFVLHGSFLALAVDTNLTKPNSCCLLDGIPARLCVSFM